MIQWQDCVRSGVF